MLPAGQCNVEPTKRYSSVKTFAVLRSENGRMSTLTVQETLHLSIAKKAVKDSVCNKILNEQPPAISNLFCPGLQTFTGGVSALR